jgi:hypothetical protein
MTPSSHGENPQQLAIFTATLAPGYRTWGYVVINRSRRPAPVTVTLLWCLCCPATDRGDWMGQELLPLACLVLNSPIGLNKNNLTWINKSF